MGLPNVMAATDAKTPSSAESNCPEQINMIQNAFKFEINELLPTVTLMNDHKAEFAEIHV